MHNDQINMREIKHYTGYAMLPCFTVDLTEEWEEADMTCSDLLFTLFRIFFAPFWNGKVKVTGQYIERRSSYGPER